MQSGDKGEAEKWIKHYRNRHEILLVGEGDFSFAACLARAFGHASNIVATSLDTKGKNTHMYMHINIFHFLCVRMYTKMINARLFTYHRNIGGQAPNCGSKSDDAGKHGVHNNTWSRCQHNVSTPEAEKPIVRQNRVQFSPCWFHV